MLLITLCQIGSALISVMAGRPLPVAPMTPIVGTADRALEARPTSPSVAAGRSRTLWGHADRPRYEGLDLGTHPTVPRVRFRLVLVAHRSDRAAACGQCRRVGTRARAIPGSAPPPCERRSLVPA